MPGIVYILENEYMPNLVKIGRTETGESLEKRMKSLSSHTGVPVPFECYYACEVKDSIKVETGLRDGFNDHRVNPKREFFKIAPERVKAVLELLALSNVTPMGDVVEDATEQNALDQARARRPNFQFSMARIPHGSELKFLKKLDENENITCKVVGDKKVEFEGEESFLNKVTLDILKSRFGEEKRAVRGPDFWLYENETLTERRLRMEASDD